MLFSRLQQMAAIFILLFLKRMRSLCSMPAILAEGLVMNTWTEAPAVLIKAELFINRFVQDVSATPIFRLRPMLFQARTIPTFNATTQSLNSTSILFTLYRAFLLHRWEAAHLLLPLLRITVPTHTDISGISEMVLRRTLPINPRTRL